MMMDLTRDWKHKWEWHKRGCVWEKLASEWAWDEDWRSERHRCQNAVNKRDVVTFALVNVNHSVIHRPRTGETVTLHKEGKRAEKIEPA